MRDESCARQEPATTKKVVTRESMTRYTVSHKEGQGVKPHANEEGSLVEAALYRVELVGPIVAASENEEILWLDPSPPYAAELAPLTRDSVLPLAEVSPMPD